MTRFSGMNIDDCCYEQSEYDSDYDSEYDSDECSTKRTRRVLGPVQLAPKKCKCVRCQWNGEHKECEQKWITINQMQAYYDEQLKLKCSELQVETSTTIAKMQAEQITALKALEEQALIMLSQHISFMSTLPKESKAGRERREAEKKKAHQEKMSKQLRKGGGFKRRVVKETAPEVIKARRALRRKESKGLKKQAEVERSTTFATVAKEVIIVEEAIVVTEVVEEAIVFTEVVEEAIVVVEEVRPKTQQVCKSVNTGLPCVHGARCRFLHPTKPKEDDWQEVKTRTRQTNSHTIEVPTQFSYNLRTRMCDSVASKKPCRHSNCRYAHSVSELVFAECSYGNECRNVNHEGRGVYSCVYNKTCLRSHPGETKESICVRAGVIIPKIIVTKVEVPFSKTVYMPTLAEATGVIHKTLSRLPKTSSAWQKQIKIESDETLASKPDVVVKVTEVKIEAATSETIRAEAFAALADTKKFDDKLLRTRMCESVAAQKACRHGDSCRFAHNISELVFAQCLFGESCRHVEYQANGVYTSVWGKTCKRLHPGETNASICERSGLKSSPVVLKAEKATPAPTAPVVLKAMPEETAPVVLKAEKAMPEETVLRVPRELAMQAMELAMRSGKTNIRVEII